MKRRGFLKAMSVLPFGWPWKAGNEGNMPLAVESIPRLYLQHGQFKSTGESRPPQFLQSGQFSSTLNSSQSVFSVDPSELEINWPD